MTSEVDIANRALSAIGTRSSIASLAENSPEARQCARLLEPLRDELLRLAPWNCATIFNNLALICSAPGTPENPSTAPATWTRGIPPPSWAYEYAYPADCLRALWIVSQPSIGPSTSPPITLAVTGNYFWQPAGMPIVFKEIIDQIGPGGTPLDGGTDTKVILTNQANATLAYIRQVINPDVWDVHFQQALVAALAWRLAVPLTGSKELAQLKMSEANSYIAQARATDGNEGLTVNDITPDWIRARGGVYDSGWLPPGYAFNWGPLFSP